MALRQNHRFFLNSPCRRGAEPAARGGRTACRFAALAMCLGLLAGCESVSQQPAPQQQATHQQTLEASASAAAPSESLTGTYWKLMTLDGQPVPVVDNQREAHLVLNAEGRVSGSTGCNRLMGSYQHAEGTLSFSQLGSTRMACLGDSQALEQEWLDTLSRTAHYSQQGKTQQNKSQQGERLILEDAQGNPLAELKANALY